MIDELLPDSVVDLVDSGCGTGYYAAELLARRPALRALELDVSADAVVGAVRATGAPGVVADVWRALPVRSERADAVLCVFAPRNAAEFARVLRPGGRLVVATPAPQHLAQLRDSGRLIGMQADKLDRLDDTLAPWFSLDARRSSRFDLELSDTEVDEISAMGPSGHHGALSDDRAVSTTVTVAIDVSVYTRR